MIKKVYFLMMVLALASTSQALASARNDIPSCVTEIPKQYRTNNDGRIITIIVDKTMAYSLDNKIKTSLFNNMKRLLMPGDIIEVVDFSSFSGSSYTKVSLRGMLDQELEKENRDYIKKSALRRFDKCIKQQKTYAIKKLAATLSKSFKPAEKSSNTELIGTLKDVSTKLISRSRADRKIVVLISDMLEHSDSMTFYANNSIRIIKPQKEMAKVTEANLLSDFGGAEVYVVGAGTLPEKYKSQYVSSKKMSALELFWQDYFKNSNATLQEFGKPMLLTEIH